jgi:PLP dependent protein
MNILIDQWTAVRERIEAACLRFHRSPNDVRLLAVSKTVPFERVAQLARAGQVDFGENYIQEALEKIQAACLELDDLKTKPNAYPVWHCIGPVQSNKTKWVATQFDWLHTLDRLKIAERLSEQRPEELEPLRVLIQVNVDQGQTKSGVSPEEVLALAKSVMSLKGLCLKGIMTMPDFDPDYDTQVALHGIGKAVFDQVSKELGSPHWDTLSMGMTQDLEAAVQAGSTMVRVGTAIFGARGAI